MLMAISTESFMKWWHSLWCERNWGWITDWYSFKEMDKMESCQERLPQHSVVLLLFLSSSDVSLASKGHYHFYMHIYHNRSSRLALFYVSSSILLLPVSHVDSHITVHKCIITLLFNVLQIFPLLWSALALTRHLYLHCYLGFTIFLHLFTRRLFCNCNLINISFYTV